MGTKLGSTRGPLWGLCAWNNYFREADVGRLVFRGAAFSLHKGRRAGSGGLHISGWWSTPPMVMTCLLSHVLSFPMDSMNYPMSSPASVHQSHTCHFQPCRTMTEQRWVTLTHSPHLPDAQQHSSAVETETEGSSPLLQRGCDSI